jgi:phosphatidylglycerol:prolipoprotein diacylglycerol transferase
LYPYVQFFGRSIGTYGLISVIAALLCCFLFINALKKNGVMMEMGILFFLFIIGGVVVGGHLLYAITMYRYIPWLFKKAELSIWFARAQYIFGGSVFYGGLLGGLGCGYLGVKILRQDAKLYADLMAPIVPLFHAFARVGCFFAGCCYGIPCEWGFMAHGNTLVPPINGVTRFPVQLLEAVLNLILAGVLYLLLRRSRKSPMLRGNLLKIYFVLYGIIRFFDEFLRGDVNRGIWGMFSTSQWISIAAVCVSGTLLIISIIRERNQRFILNCDKSC